MRYGLSCASAATSSSTSPRSPQVADGVAVAATIGVGAGEYLSDTSRSLRRALVMAAATLAGSIVPAIPFVTGYGRSQGRYRGYRITLGILAIVGSLTIGLSVLVA